MKNIINVCIPVLSIATLLNPLLTAAAPIPGGQRHVIPKTSPSSTTATPASQPQIAPLPPSPQMQGLVDIKQASFQGTNFQHAIAVTSTGPIVVDLSIYSRPAANAPPPPLYIGLRNEVTGQIQAFTKTGSTLARLSYTVTATDIQQGGAVYSIIVSNANSGMIRTIYPKTDMARRDQYLGRLTPEQRVSIFTALGEARCDVTQLARVIAPKTPLPMGAERCFGATGRGCATQLLGEIPFKPEFVTRINPDCTVDARVSVGSIFHDNCCNQYSNGLYCQGEFVANMFLQDLPSQFLGLNCSREWRKAVYDVVEDRSWVQKFGPYYFNADGSVKSDFIGGLINPPREGYTYGGGIDGVRDKKMLFTLPQREATERLKAPSGTKLEYGDEKYCASGKFRTFSNEFGTYPHDYWCGAGVGPARICSDRAKHEHTLRNGNIIEVTAAKHTYDTRVQHWGYCE